MVRIRFTPVALLLLNGESAVFGRIHFEIK